MQKSGSLSQWRPKVDARVQDAPQYDEPDKLEMSNSILRVMRGINGQASRLFGTKVLAGPFSGMEIPLVTEWDDGNFGTKLFGTYEHELRSALMHAIWRRPQVVVNVGCGEGYYAIGLARLVPGAQVYAFDISDSARSVCKEYGTLNEVNNLFIYKGVKTPGELALSETCFGHRLYVVDIEGDEMEILDPEQCPALKHSDIIVECHDFLRANASSIIADRFYATHDVALVWPKLPDFEAFEFLKHFPTVMTVLLVVEKRPMPTLWLTCWAKQKETRNG